MCSYFVFYDIPHKIDYQTICEFLTFFIDTFLCYYYNYAITFSVTSLLKPESRSKLPNVTLCKLYKILKSY